MDIKVDEDLPRSVVTLLKAYSYAAQGVYEQMTLIVFVLLLKERPSLLPS